MLPHPPPPPLPPGTYIPRKEVVVEETIRATIIKPNQAIKLRARKETLVSRARLRAGWLAEIESPDC